MQQSIHNVVTHVAKKIDKSQNCQLHIYRFNYTKDFLGEGTFGKVFKAKDSQQDEVVAVKIMNYGELKKDAYLKQSLRNEILIMKQLSSPHIVSIVDVLADQDDKELYIILEFCEGGDLRHLMIKNKRFTEQQATEILSQLLEGFRTLVSQGYIHRDIKPENCLIKNRIFKVADFGFATKIDITGRQHLRECVGTPLYMAPQLLERQPYGAKSDIWSIGLMYYEMLFGRAPWPCHDMKTYLSYIRTSPLRFPYEISASEAAKSFIRQCLTIDESQRLGWDKLFNHPLFQTHQQHQVQKETKGQQKLEERLHQIKFTESEKKVLSSLQDTCQYKGKHPSAYFAECQNKQFQADQFYMMLSKIDPKVTNELSKGLFDKFDLSGDGIVSGQEFYMVFCEYDFSNVDDEAKHLLIELREIINRHQLDLNDIFKHFDKDGHGTLDQEEFDHFIRVIAPKLPPHIVKQLFNRFDKDHSGTVTLKEFYEAIQLPRVSGQECDKTKAFRVFNQFRGVVIDKQVDIRMLFKKYDVSGDGLINITEFNDLIKKVQDNLTDLEVKYLFDLFDVDKNGQVSFQEFYQRLTL